MRGLLALLILHGPILLLDVHGPLISVLLCAERGGGYLGVAFTTADFGRG